LLFLLPASGHRRIKRLPKQILAAAEREFSPVLKRLIGCRNQLYRETDEDPDTMMSAVFVPGGYGPMIDLLDDPDAGRPGRKEIRARRRANRSGTLRAMTKGVRLVSTNKLTNWRIKSARSPDPCAGPELADGEHAAMAMGTLWATVCENQR
jgi:hypothetical protein